MKKRIMITAISAAAALLAFASCGHDVPRADSAPDDAAITTVSGETTTSTDESSETKTTKSTRKKDKETEPETETTTKATVTAYVAGAGGPVGTAPKDNNSNGNGSTSGTISVTPTGINLSYNSAELVVGQTKQYPQVYGNIKEVWSSTDPKVATVDSIGNITAVGAGECIIRVVSASDNSLGAEVKVKVIKMEGIQQVDGITYADGILIANKTYSLPSNYNPGGLTADTSAAFSALVAGASNDGIAIWNVSGFRSYDYQAMLYNNYCAQSGQATADTFSARPGHSEHQTGLAIDCNMADDGFIGTAAAIWLEEHCHEYGFIIRYPQGKQSITGYKYEPWHIRYIGRENAQKLREAAQAAGDPYLTLEEYFGITSAYQN